ncbi:MAG: hypothetical protein ACREUS_04675, partial [Burkholderiales bacterium]
MLYACRGANLARVGTGDQPRPEKLPQRSIANVCFLQYHFETFVSIAMSPQLARAARYVADHPE